MAEGGMEYYNEAFDRDDYTDYYDDEDYKAFEEEMAKNYNAQRTADVLNESLSHSTGEDLEDVKTKLIKTKLDNFLEFNKAKGGTPTVVIPSDFVVEDNILYYKGVDAEDKPLEYKRGGRTIPYTLSSLTTKYSVSFVRGTLGFIDYEGRKVDKSKQAAVLLKARDEITTSMEHIPLASVSNTSELQALSNTVNDIETAVKSLETSLADWDMEERVDTPTQTEGLNLRELQGLDKALQRIRGELVNNLAKLTDIDKDIAKEKQKLQQAGDDEVSIQQINDRLKDLQDERSARLEAASENKEALRGQVSRIKETINRVLKEDTTLGEKLRTLFKEQGITIVSVLTAIGMIIGVIVEAVIPSGGGGGSTTPPPKDGSGVKDWVKKTIIKSW